MDAKRIEEVTEELHNLLEELREEVDSWNKGRKPKACPLALDGRRTMLGEALGYEDVRTTLVCLARDAAELAVRIGSAEQQAKREERLRALGKP